jgi:hypothetical protein
MLGKVKRVGWMSILSNAQGVQMLGVLACDDFVSAIENAVAAPCSHGNV